MGIVSRSSAAALAAVIAMLATGCSGKSVSPLPAVSGARSAARAPMSAGSAGGSLFHKNSEKYADAGSHPVTGRSGSAVVQSRALLAKDGSTLLEATTGTLDAQPGPGNVRHVSVTPAINGKDDNTVVYNNLKAGGYWSHTYAALAHNESVKVDTNIDGIDTPRTDVVTTNDTVKKRPDLAVSVGGPAKAYRNRPVTFVAPVHELNGDVGARADCVLSVDGAQVDQAQGIWVDAGGNVACSFTTAFASLGIKHVTVTVGNVVPGDWDTANNVAQTTIEIVDPIVKLHTTGSASNTTWNDRGTETYSYNDYWWYNYSESSTTNWDNNNHTSDLWIDGYSFDHQVQLPVQQFAAGLTVDGAQTFAADNTTLQFAPPQGSGDWSCQYTFGGGSDGNICSGPGYTAVYFHHYSEQVTYYSVNYDNYCEWYGCYTSSWVSNYTTSNGVTPVNIGNAGSTDVLSIGLTDSAGTQFKGTTTPAVVQPVNYSNAYNYCYGYGWYYYDNYCYNGVTTETGANFFAPYN